MFDSEDTANEFLKYINGRHNSIKFTIEFEQATFNINDVGPEQEQKQAKSFLP